MSAQVVIGTEGGTCVVLRDAISADDEGWSYFVVELHAAGLDVVNGVTTHVMAPLDHYFDDLEQHWRGWPSQRTWESTEPGLSISALHNGRHVQLTWTTTEGPESLWRASLTFLVEPGEELKALAHDVRDLLLPNGPSA